MKRCENGSCVQLDENNLCQVQKNFGEEHLPDVCYTFPRSYKLLDKNIYMTANLACPESLKVALFNNKKSDFLNWSEIEQSRSKTGLADNREKSLCNLSESEIIGVFSAIIKIFDDHSFDSDLSLAKLLLLTNQIESRTDFNWLKIEEEIAAISRDKIFEFDQKTFDQIDMRLELFVVIKALLQLLKIERNRYNQMLSVVLEYLGEQFSAEEKIKNYEEIFNSWSNSKSKFDQILKNLVKAKLSYQFFPLTAVDKKQFMAAISLEFLAVKLALMCWNHKLQRDMTNEEIIDVIQPITKRFYALKKSKVEEFCQESNWQNLDKLAMVTLNFS
jgi:lysine-N-methylase